MADILIGNVRGPQGETGPSNKLLATVYSFCESDSPNEIPAGPWLDNLEDVEKGKWYWCKNTMTWEDGPESYLYSVGYVGFDGDFTGVELVQSLENRVKTLEDRTLPISKGGTESTTLEGAQAKLGITALQTRLTQAIEDHKKVATETENGLMSATDKKRLDGINDYTTGINLIRGSRDFRLGTKPIAHIYEDGFSATISQYVSILEGDDGFAIGHLEQSGTTANTYRNFVTSAIEHFSNGDVYTISFEFMVDDASKYVDQQFPFAAVIRDTTTNQNLSSKTFYFTDLGLPSNLESKKWYEVKTSYTVVNNITDNHILYFAFQLIRDGSLNFRKLMVQHGEIDNSIWAPNPADLVLEPVNDITTGINLLRGTRDFTQGSTRWGNSGYLTDGVYISSGTTWSREVDSEGYTNLVYTSSNASQVYTINGIFVYDKGLAYGNEYTISYEIMADNDIPITALNSAAVAITKRNKATNADGKTFANGDLSKTDATNVANFEYGKWHKVVMHFVIDEQFSSDEGLRIACSARYAGHIRFRKLKLEIGHIEHSEWTASPFDVVQQSVWNSTIPLALGQLQIIRKAEEYTLADDQFLQPGQWAFSNQDIPYISDKPDDLATSYGFDLMTKYVWSDQTRVQILYQTTTCDIRIRHVSSNGATTSPWKKIQLV